MLKRRAEKSIPSTYLYAEIKTQWFESDEAYVDHILARQQDIHNLVRLYALDTGQDVHFKAFTHIIVGQQNGLHVQQVMAKL